MKLTRSQEILAWFEEAEKDLAKGTPPEEVDAVQELASLWLTVVPACINRLEDGKEAAALAVLQQMSPRKLVKEEVLEWGRKEGWLVPLTEVFLTPQKKAMYLAELEKCASGV